MRLELAHCLALLMLALSPAMHAQSKGGSTPLPPPSMGTQSNAPAPNRGDMPSFPGLDHNGFPGGDPNFMHRQMTARREELHRRMVDNAARLVALTRELQEDVHLHEANEADAKRLDDISKLARAVRDQMRQ